MQTLGDNSQIFVALFFYVCKSEGYGEWVWNAVWLCQDVKCRWMNMCQWGWHWMGEAVCFLEHHHKWSRCFWGRDVKQNDECYSCLPPERSMQLKCEHEWSKIFFHWQQCALKECEQSRRHELLSSETSPFVLAIYGRKEVVRHCPQPSSWTWYTNMSEIWGANMIWYANMLIFSS